MTTFGSNLNLPPQPARPSQASVSEERRAAVAERMSAELLAGRSPHQRELAGTIFRRLSEGAEVEDLEPLIQDLQRTAVDDYRRRGRAGH
ncbi:hypothetical protein [Streptacidiphilus jiangxiensis]|uniref:Uncharacterized protein n=1 Tax=Streptacidiphilus jiangxiensis TaxID=235985 RepID=A0A1H7S3X5_STRJI|nr:hypothetical protein [Streptacidiphilus jiangxiensis]SEL66989.1 hypothetical protein SAMN05414137_111128 [Streptacidiphilus jiangxiensis]